MPSPSLNRPAPLPARPPKVLISIQSLILVDEPYFNGGGTLGGAGGRAGRRAGRRAGGRAGRQAGIAAACPPDPRDWLAHRIWSVGLPYLGGGKLDFWGSPLGLTPLEPPPNRALQNNP